jgi:hypothetical protein
MSDLELDIRNSWKNIGWSKLTDFLIWPILVSILTIVILYFSFTSGFGIWQLFLIPILIIFILFMLLFYPLRIIGIIIRKEKLKIKIRHPIIQITTNLFFSLQHPITIRYSKDTPYLLIQQPIKYHISKYIDLNGIDKSDMNKLINILLSEKNVKLLDRT